MITLANYINGTFTPPTCTQYLTTLNPATGQPLALVPDSDSTDVNAAVRAAAKAFPGWSATTRAERSKLMLRIADILESRLDEFALLESMDQGMEVLIVQACVFMACLYCKRSRACVCRWFSTLCFTYMNLFG